MRKHKSSMYDKSLHTINKFIKRTKQKSLWERLQFAAEIIFKLKKEKENSSFGMRKGSRNLRPFLKMIF